jgi:hypothetical protein
MFQITYIGPYNNTDELYSVNSEEKHIDKIQGVTSEKWQIMIM